MNKAQWLVIDFSDEVFVQVEASTEEDAVHQASLVWGCEPWDLTGELGVIRLAKVPVFTTKRLKGFKLVTSATPVT